MKSTFFSTCLLFALTACGASALDHGAVRRHHARKVASAAVSAAEKMNKANGGTPASMFTAKSSLPIKELASAALKAHDKGITYAISQGSKTHSTIYTDWSNFKSGAAFVWTADMDVDCDGIDSTCTGNPDGQRQTDFGALAAYEVPFIVIPGTFAAKYKKDLPQNNVVAVICDGKMYYGIFGDTNGDSPEVIGEASWLMAKTCFPSGKITGNNGHGQADVTYIAFTGKNAVMPSSSMTSNYITDFTVLKSMGDKLVGDLATNLKLAGGSTTNTTSSATKAGSSKAASTKPAANAAAAVPTTSAAGCKVNRADRR